MMNKYKNTNRIITTFMQMHATEHANIMSIECQGVFRIAGQDMQSVFAPSLLNAVEELKVRLRMLLSTPQFK